MLNKSDVGKVVEEQLKAQLMVAQCGKSAIISWWSYVFLFAMIILQRGANIKKEKISNEFWNQSSIFTSLK